MTSSTAHPEVRLLKRLLAGNPFYIVSAALLLYSIYGLSVDSRLFSAETPQLFFNFTAFQVYELLLTFTAIILARRTIWYDSALLVSLENLFVFVPFILISQALLLESHIAFIFCFAGCALVVIRMAALRRSVAAVNMPFAFVAIGCLLLAVNVALPVITRMLHENSNMFVWDKRGTMVNSFGWMLLLPALVVLLNTLPHPSPRLRETHPAFFMTNTFPLTALLLLVLGTGVHLYCIDYVYGLSWSNALLTPVLWMTAWTIIKRRHDFDLVPVEIRNFLQKPLLITPVISLLLAAYYGNWTMVLVLTSLNTILFGAVAFKKREKLQLQLAFISAALMFGSLPLDWIPSRLVDGREEALYAASFVYLLIRATLSRSAKAGVLGSLIAAFGIWKCRTGVDPGYYAAQAGVIYVLLHSLKWRMEEGVETARWVAGAIWAVHSVAWMAEDYKPAAINAALCGIFVVGACLIMRKLTNTPQPRVVGYAGIIQIILPLAFGALRLLKEAPPAIVVLLGSFILFGIGTAVALTKHRWYETKQISPATVETNNRTL